MPMMFATIRLFLLSLMLIIPGFSHAQEEPFFHEGVARDAAKFEDYLKKNWSTQGTDHAGWLRKGRDAWAAKNSREAASAFAAAVVLKPDDAATWLNLARAYLAIKSRGSKERYRLPYNASSAAYIAVKRSVSKEDRAASLAVLAYALARRSYWRPALNAYKASLAEQEVKDVRTAYEALRNQRGFRILDYKVNSDTATPRVCVQFSETLARGRIDFGSYLKLDGKDPAGVAKEDRELCVAGLAHGKRYEITVREGLPSTVGEVLQKSAQLIIYVRDRQPSARFTGRNYVLPRTGQNGIPLVTVNTKSVSIKIYRVGDRSLINAVINGNFSRQISGHEAERLGNTLGTRVWSGVMPVNQVLNEEVTTAIPIQDALPKIEPGLYAMVAAPGEQKSENWKSRATQWFIVSNLGVTAFTAADGIHGFVRSLASAEPLRNVELRLIARNNEVLGNLQTDGDGHAVFAQGLARGKGGKAPAILIAQDGAGDYAFVDLTRSSFDLTDRGVGGRAAPGPIDAYVFTERGVYRPGEQIHLTALIRDAKGAGVPGLPATLVLTRPDGVEHSRNTLPDGGFGGRTHAISLSQSAMTGTWRAALYVDPKGSPVGSASFLVEDFVPQRLELKVNAESKMAIPGETTEISLNGRYLYGAPASNLAIEGNVTIKSSQTDLEGFAGYRFGLEDEDFTPVRRPLLDLPRTGADGTARLRAVLPAVGASTRLMQASFDIRLREPGGRTVEKTLSLPVKSKIPLLGLKALFKDGHVEYGGKANFELIAVGPDSKFASLAGLKWELLKVERRFQWYSQNGAWNYESMDFTSRVANGTIDASADRPASISAEVEWGRYRLEVTSADPTGPAVSHTFTAGWYTAESADTPDILDIALDKQDYAVGDTVSVKLMPRLAGKAQVAVITDRVVALKTIDVPEGGTEVALKANEDWAPGAYVTATFYRPMDRAARRMPGRSIGIKWVKLNQRKQLIGIDIDAAKQARPKQPLTIPIKLTGLMPGSDARLVLAAVDVGILNLTRYEPPEPEKWFYGQRRLGAEIRDIYGRLIDGMQAVRGRIRSGGDGAGVALQGPPPSQKPVSLFSGLFTVGNDGKAEVTFDIPAFDGTLRLMAVAWNGNQLGHAVKDIVVRDSVVLVGTAPRFLSTGDQSQLHLSIDNVEGPTGAYTLAIRPEGPLTTTTAAAEQTFNLKAEQRLDFAIPLTASSHGDAEIEVRLSGPESFELTRSYTVPVHPAEPNVTRRFVHSLPGNGGALTLSRDIFSNLDPTSVKISLNVGQSRALDIPGLLLALDRYPYGCAEQTTSRALPLLYLSSVAEGAGLAGEASAKMRVQKAITRLRGMQNGSGGFGFWSPSSQDMWLTAYVTDFLTRAREQGYDVGQMLDQALDRLKNFANYAPDFASGGEDVAYAHYVLARNGRAGIGDLRYYADTKLKNFTSPLARAQLGAALALYGDKSRAETVFQSTVSALEKPDDIFSRLDYGSPLRDGAAALTLVSETSFAQNAVKSLSDVIDRLSEKRDFTSTQENAWLLLAANALQNRQSELVFSVNGKPSQGTISRVLTAKDLEDTPFKVANDNVGAVTATVTVSGAALAPEPPISKGFRITREIYTLDGKPVSLDSVKQNQRFVIVIKVDEVEAKRGRLLVADRLPAGFEIENPRLVDSASLKSFSWLRSTALPEHTEFRDDKFLAAFNLTKRNAKQPPAQLAAAYMVRAVSPGTYLHPAATVEDMYRPERLARTEAGSSRILAGDR